MPDGELGEIWVRGEQVSGEYLGVDPSAVDGWFNTRDSGRLDDEGYLFVHGRLDDVIIRGGENLSPGEIEAVLIEHPAVESAAVVGIPDVEWGERVVAAVVLQPGAAVDERSCATTSAAPCGRLARPSASSSRSSCRSTRPASSCAGCCGTSWPASSAPTPAERAPNDRAGPWRRARCRAPRARSRRRAPPASSLVLGLAVWNSGITSSRTARGSSRCPRGCSCLPG